MSHKLRVKSDGTAVNTTVEVVVEREASVDLVKLLNVRAVRFEANAGTHLTVVTLECYVDDVEFLLPMGAVLVEPILR